MPSSEIALWCEIACFDEQEEHPLFLYPYLTDSGNCQNTRNMQQTINFEAQAQTVRPALNVRATIQRKIKTLNHWLDQKSEFYSRIAEFSVTRRLVLRVNAVTLCLMLAAIAVEQRPLVAITSALCAGWMVYRINKTDKKGGKK